MPSVSASVDVWAHLHSVQSEYLESGVRGFELLGELALVALLALARLRAGAPAATPRIALQGLEPP
jgi:hypothetical protein